MAGEGTDTEQLTDGTHEPRECMACRGTGRVISNLGGSPSSVDCPWCGGGGLRPAEIDAQAHWGAGEDPAGGQQGEATPAGASETPDGEPTEDGAS